MANEKKVALITGANKGLGYEMAKQLAQAGVTVVLAARDAAKGESAAAKLKSEGLDVRALKLEVTNEKDQADAASVSGKELRQIDILINNAGISADGLAGTSVSATTARSLQDYLRYELLRAHCADTKAAPLAEEKRRRQDRKHVEHPRFTSVACRPEKSHL